MAGRHQRLGDSYTEGGAVVGSGGGGGGGVAEAWKDIVENVRYDELKRVQVAYLVSLIFGICLVIVSIVDASRAHHPSFSASLATLMLVCCVYMIMAGYQLFTLRWQSQTAVNYFTALTIAMIPYVVTFGYYKMLTSGFAWPFAISLAVIAVLSLRSRDLFASSSGDYGTSIDETRTDALISNYDISAPVAGPAPASYGSGGGAGDAGEGRREDHTIDVDYPPAPASFDAGPAEEIAIPSEATDVHVPSSVGSENDYMTHNDSSNDQMPR